MRKESEIDILKSSISKDDRKAFNMFYDLFYDDVFRLAYYFLCDKEASREVVLDVFFSIWQSRSKLQDIENMDAYLYTVTKNKSTAYFERQKHHAMLSIDDMAAQYEDTVSATTDSAIQDKEMEELLRQAIEELPKRCRMVFLLARQRGLKAKEIGELLSINESTVRVQMKIAVKKIIDYLHPYFPDLTLTVLFCFLF